MHFWLPLRRAEVVVTEKRKGTKRSDGWMVFTHAEQSE
jgi:hypothetical protein